MTQPDVAGIVAALRVSGATVATAESLTGGLVCATLVDVPGASDVVRGAIVAYQSDLKTSLLGVAAQLVAREGTVHPEVAVQLADGARERLGATWGLATTGVAGPGPSEGHAAGTVHVAVAGPGGTTTRELHLTGDRSRIRVLAVHAVLSDLRDRLGNNADPTGVGTDMEGGGDDRDA